MTKDDAEVYSFFSGIKPRSEDFPDLSRWYQTVEDKLISSYLGKDCGQAASVEPAAQSQEFTAEALRMNAHTVAGLVDLDDKLSGKSYITGEEMTKDDVEVYALFGAKRPNAKYYPDARRWHRAVSENFALSMIGKDGCGGQAAADVKRMLEKKAAEENGKMLACSQKRKREVDSEEEKKVAEETKEAANKGHQGMATTMATAEMLIPWPFDVKRTERYKKEIQEYVSNLNIHGLVRAECEFFLADYDELDPEMNVIVCLHMKADIADWIADEFWSLTRPWRYPLP